MIGPEIAPESVMVEKMLSDARSEADRIIEKARFALESGRKRAEIEAEEIRKDMIARTVGQIEKIMKREISIAKMEARRTLLNAREKLISIAYESIRRRLSDMRREPIYRESLLNLSSEAIKSVGGDRVILRFSNLDRNVVDQGFLDELLKRTDKRIEVEVRMDLSDEKAGCIALSGDQRVVFDNTYDARMKRLEQTLRARIVEELRKQDG
ncbi:MAG: V-type ATP synthase subunit E [bacterium]